MRKDNVDLICSIGELAGIFERSASLEDFLQTVVSTVAYHMRAAVCSVYLYDEESRELVLTANQGLSRDSVGRVRLKLGEGLTGLALKELRAICEGSASRSPNYKYIPGIQEEQYQAFLAVPILRGTIRVGVLVLQDPVPDYFDNNDAKALQAIAAQLASTIENAKLFIALHSMRTDLESRAAPARPIADLRFLKGKGVARGHAIGHPTVFGNTGVALVTAEATAATPGGTKADFENSLERTEQQLEALQLQMEQRLADIASMIFSAHLLMLKDTQFSGTMLRMIEGGRSAREAILAVVNQYVDLFSASTNIRLREKVQDVKDLGYRLIRNLESNPEETPDYTGHIVITSELLPSDILKLSIQNAEGIVVVGGGETTHVAILARALEIPMVVLDDAALLQVSPTRRMLMDGDEGNIHLDPDAAILERYSLLDHTELEAAAYAAKMPATTTTADGVRIRLLANINMLSELKVAHQLKAEGVGLYRSEFPFIVRSSFPSEEEQYRVYRRLVEDMAGKEVTFRTLDVGGDKMLSYAPSHTEANPVLGLRAIRFSLRYRDIFEQQLRAMLRAGVDTALRIMFPLISSVDDLQETRAVVEECVRQLTNEHVPHNPNPKLGAMIELPAAVEIAEELAREANFLSIGGNDLVQYILAVDRGNAQLADLYRAHHPAVLRSLRRIAVAAQANQCPLSFCGEMATDIKMLPFLVGIGIDTLSVDPHSIPRLHQEIGKLDSRRCKERATQLLALSRICDVEALLGQA